MHAASQLRLDELKYERIRHDADLLDLIELEGDLALRLRWRLVDLHGCGEEVDAELERSLDRAWRRLAEDLSIDIDDEPGDCPLCQGCPSSCSG